jgi:hypothetical protein
LNQREEFQPKSVNLKSCSFQFHLIKNKFLFFDKISTSNHIFLASSTNILEEIEKYFIATTIQFFIIISNK